MDSKRFYETCGRRKSMEIIDFIAKMKIENRDKFDRVIIVVSETRLDSFDNLDVEELK